MNDITGIREGDAAVFRAVYEQLHVKVFRYFLKRTTLHETATELTQQLFIKLWQSRHTLSDSYSMEAQLFIMANSVLIDHLRKEAVNRKNYSTVAGLEPLAETRYEQEAHHSLEASDYLRLAIHQLPPVRKKVFILKMFHGYSNREIAGRLSVSVKTVEDHLLKAMRQIRSLLTTLWLFLITLLP